MSEHPPVAHSRSPSGGLLHSGAQQQVGVEEEVSQAVFAVTAAAVRHEAVAHQLTPLRRKINGSSCGRGLWWLQPVGFFCFLWREPHHAVAERHLSSVLRTLVEAVQEAAGQPQGFLQGRQVPVFCRAGFQHILQHQRTWLVGWLVGFQPFGR